MPRPEESAAPVDEMPDGVVLLEEPLEPDEEFWQKYSPHFEMPIGWVSGLLVVAMMFAAVVLIVRYADREPDKAGVPIVLSPEFGEDDAGDGSRGAISQRSAAAFFAQVKCGDELCDD